MANRRATVFVVGLIVLTLLILGGFMALWFGAYPYVPGETETPTPSAWPQIRIISYASGFSQPTYIANAHDGSGRLFVVERAGRVRIIMNGNVLPTPFLDISARVGHAGPEQGLLSVAFPPKYASKGYFYVDYIDLQGNTVVSRFHLTSDPNAADPQSEEIVLTVQQPFANHNGGQLAFGPNDGYLYVGLGDGGSEGDPLHNGQKTDLLLAKILRIDVESGVKPYAVPPTNPYVNRSGFRPETWAYGLRNPWRFSFDSITGDLFIADVGQNSWEEVNIQLASSKGGENYGWSIMEGDHCYGASTCDETGLTLPVTEYSHSEGCAVTGGFVYRGNAYPSLRGIYFYGDYCSGRIWGIRQGYSTWESALLTETNSSITTFGTDESGAVYFDDYRTGDIYKIIDVYSSQ